jgi:hypothetical protein
MPTIFFVWEAQVIAKVTAARTTTTAVIADNIIFIVLLSPEMISTERCASAAPARNAKQKPFASLGMSYGSVD